MPTSNRDKGKVLIQAWLWNDPETMPNHTEAIKIWNQLKQKNNGRTADLMTQCLIAYNEKVEGGYQPVTDETPMIMRQMRDYLKRMESIANKLSNLDFTSTDIQSDIQSVKMEVSDAINGIDLNIISDKMTFDDSDD